MKNVLDQTLFDYHIYNFENKSKQMRYLYLKVVGLQVSHKNQEF
jgi:hypothetical protein